MIYQASADASELQIFSLLRSRFFLSSLIFHGMLFLFALRIATLTALPKESNRPISVQLLEVRDGVSPDKSIGRDTGPGGPRTMPKLGTPRPPVAQTGKTTGGSIDSSVSTKPSEETAAPPKPVALPGPKVLAADTREAVNAKETSADSLVRLPTKESPTNLPSSVVADQEANQRSLAALKGVDEDPGIKALKDGVQIPGALKGDGAGRAAFGVPGGSGSGTGTAGGGTGVGSGGGSLSGLKGLPSADYSHYLSQLKKRVESVWKYPEGVSGVQKVAVLFTLDRAGRLVHSEVLDSSDSRLNASAVEAMKRASPFPAIPESLKELANSPLRMQFTVSIGVRG
jgi:TonB family protein